MTAGRRIWAGLHLLDRQIVDRDGRMAGCVDDLELAPREDGGDLYVTALISGPGALAERLGRRRYGSWLRRVHRLTTPVDGDPAVIPFARVSEIAACVRVAADFDELGSASGERWARENVVARIPGSGHAAE